MFLTLIKQVQTANNKTSVEISLISIWLTDRKLVITKPSPPKVEAIVNANVEQLAHVLEIILIVVPDTADLLILNFKFVRI